VVPVPSEAYDALEEQATYRIPRDPDDVPTVALALALGGGEDRCGVWTGDNDFLGCGVSTWTTDALLAHLRYTGRT
jgi:predicted nucleic acid-binding protein